MIKVEGYKAFHGLMRIESKSKRVPVIEIEGDWLYKPHTNCWYGKGVSYPAKVCTVVSDDAEILQSEVRLLRGDNRNLQDLCNAEKAKVEKLHNKLIDMAKSLQAARSGFRLE